MGELDGLLFLALRFVSIRISKLGVFKFGSQLSKVAAEGPRLISYAERMRGGLFRCKRAQQCINN